MSKTTMLSVQYSAFPALIFVKEEEDGRKLVTPVPLKNGDMLFRLGFRLGWYWFITTLVQLALSLLIVAGRVGLLEMIWLWEDLSGLGVRVWHYLRVRVWHYIYMSVSFNPLNLKWAIEWAIKRYYKVRLGLVMGATWRQSLAWGFQGI